MLRKDEVAGDGHPGDIKSSIAGAQVAITNVGTGVTRQTVTNTDGNYTITSLVPGRYRAVDSKDGL